MNIPRGGIFGKVYLKLFHIIGFDNNGKIKPLELTKKKKKKSAEKSVAAPSAPVAEEAPKEEEANPEKEKNNE